VALDVRSEQQGLFGGDGMHVSAVVGEDGAVDDETRRGKSGEGLPYELPGRRDLHGATGTE
jgi:hypothetical protein